MATASIKEQILQAVAAQLRTITVANGYSADVADVVRPRRTGERFVPTDRGIGLLMGDEVRATDYDLAGYPAAIAWRMTVQLDLVIRLSERAAEAMDSVLNAFAADVQKAVMADVQWSGLAIDTALVGSVFPEPSAGVEGVTQLVEIIYRVAENDPAVNRA